MIIENDNNEHMLVTVSKEEAVELIRSLAETINVTRGDAVFHKSATVILLKDTARQPVGRRTSVVLTVKVKK